MITDHTFEYIIGIDPGTQCGFAVWDVSKQEWFEEIKSVRIWEVFEELSKININKIEWAKRLCDGEGIAIPQIHLVIEDPTQVRFKTDPKKSQGAGAVKWCFRQIVDFCEAHGISYETRRPSKQLTKYSAQYFKQVTGYSARTNQHGRDAAMLVYGHSGRVVTEKVGV